LHAGRQTVVRDAREFNSGSDLGLHALDKQDVVVAVFGVSHDDATSFSAWLDATFAVNLRGLLWRGCGTGRE
jgi:hypothetical protein